MAQQGGFPHEAVADSEVIFDTTPTPDIAMNRYGDGLFTVVWEGRKAGPEETSNIKKQLFSYGRPLGAEDMVNLLPEGSQSSPSIDISAGGITAVVWRHVRHNKGIIDDKIQMRLINAGVDFYMWNIVEYGYDPKVCFAGDDVIIVWGIGHGFYDKAIQARRYYSFGVPKDGVFDVYPAHYGGEAIGIERGGHRLDCFENGSFVVSWWERDESTQEEIVWFQVYDSNDDPMFQEPTGDCVPDWSINPKGVCVEGPSAGLPNVLALPDGGVRVACFDADEDSIKVSCFNEGEENAHLEFSVPYRPGAFAPAISGDIHKTFIAWVAQENGESYFRAARYDMTGDELQAMEWDQFEGETHPTVSRFCPDLYECSGDSIRTVGPDVSGNFVLAWSVQVDPEKFPDRHDVMIRCFDEYGSGFPCGVDVDGDGVLDMYDCDRLNPYLRYDVDQDGVCDEITGGNEADCINACYEVYEGTGIDECIYRCQNLDNCPCFRDGCPGVDDPDTIAAAAARLKYPNLIVVSPMGLRFTT